MKQKCFKWIEARTLVQKAVCVALVLEMVVLWPLCLVRESAENRAGDDAQEVTEELLQGMSFEQRFRAINRYLSTIDYVLGFDPAMSLEGEFLFELFDESGEMLYSTTYPYNLTPDYRYCPIQVSQRLKKNGIYVFRLTNVSVTENAPCVVYTVDEDMYPINSCGMLFDGETVSGEALVRYTWSVPLQWKKVLMYWGITGIISCCVFELEEVRRIKHKVKT